MTLAPYQVMPALSAEEYAALKADIAARGVQVPIEYDETGHVLDGHHRIAICAELGIANWPRLVRYGLTDDEKRRHARRLNLDRRHLDQQQRRELIAEELRERPRDSDRAIAAGLGVHHGTVGSERKRLESTGQISQLDERRGRDQRVRKIVQFVPGSEAEERGLSISARALNERNRRTYREGARSLASELSSASALQPCGRRFPCVYADPAWRRKAGFGNRAYENHYGTMSWDEIIAMPVAQRLLPDAWGFLWIPRPHLFALHPVEVETPIGRTTIKMPLAWAVAHAWGFDSYSTCFVWTKTDEIHPDDHGSGLIVWDQDELLLLFKRGRGLPMPSGAEKVGSNHRERAGDHSAKPDFYRSMINVMTGGVPVLELFAREDDEHPLPENFFTWGNQSKNSAELPELTDSTGAPLPHDPESGEIPETTEDRPPSVPVSEPACAVIDPAARAGSLDADDPLMDIPDFLRRKAG